MSNDQEAARRRAENAYRQNSQTQVATEQAIRDANTRNACNAELARQRAATARYATGEAFAPPGPHRLHQE